MDTQARERALLRDLVSELDRAVARTMDVIRAGGGHETATVRTRLQTTRAWAKAALALDEHIEAKRARLAREGDRMTAYARWERRAHVVPHSAPSTPSTGARRDASLPPAA